MASRMRSRFPFRNGGHEVMEKTSLVSVFWENHNAQDGADATIHVEDGVVLYITRADGLEVRLLITELEYIYHFALEQMHCRGAEDDETAGHSNQRGMNVTGGRV